jgi:hypothetical protein
MPLAGPARRPVGGRRLFLGALVVFTVGSLLAGMAQTSTSSSPPGSSRRSVAASSSRSATAAASHLFEGHARPRALGTVGRPHVPRHGRRAVPRRGDPRVRPARGVAGIAAGLGLVGSPAGTPSRRPGAGPSTSTSRSGSSPCARVGGVARLGDAATPWPRRRSPGAALFSLALASGLVWRDDRRRVATQAAPRRPAHARRRRSDRRRAHRDRRARSSTRSAEPTRSWTRASSGPSRSASAALVSLLTGYAFATAIIGGAVFVDRVLYGGPDDQRLALGALAAATAVGALASGFARPDPVRSGSSRSSGLALASPGSLAMATWDAEVSIESGAQPAWRALRARLRADGDAALDGRRRSRRPTRVRDGLGGRHGRPDDRDGRRPRRPDGVRLDPDRPPLRPGLWHARTRTSRSSRRRCATARCVTRSSSTRSRRGRPREAAAIMVGTLPRRRGDRHGPGGGLPGARSSVARRRMLADDVARGPRIRRGSEPARWTRRHDVEPAIAL